MTVERVLDDRYQTEQLLGSGGMGTVWRGRDLRLDRPVAIKELAAGPNDATAVERFGREARTVARLAHPNVVAVYDVGADARHPYLVMELVEGRSIAAMLADGPLPLAQAVAIAAQTCDGLTAAHDAGVIHRDIKPANLILTPAGVVKICDFGIARLQHTEGADLTGTATALGSSKFMAPEQAISGPIDQRTDLYGLGCTLYAMLAGAAPFTGDHPIAVIHQHLTQPPAPVSSRRPDVPPALDALVAALLAKDPADRPASAAQVKAQLTELFRGLAEPAAPGDVPRLTAVPAAAAIVADAADAWAARGAVDARAAVDAATPAAGAPVPSAAAADGGAAREAGTPSTPDGRRPFVVVPPGLPGPTDRPGSAGSGRTGRLALAGTALLATAGVVLALAGLLPDLVSDGSPGGAIGTAATPTAGSSAPAVPAPTSVMPGASGPTSPAAQSATSAPASATPTPPADPLTSMRLIIRQQVGAGILDRKQAQDLSKKVDELAQAVAQGDVEGATKKIKDFRARLDGLLRDDKIDPAAYDALNANLDRVAATLP